MTQLTTMKRITLDVRRPFTSGEELFKAALEHVEVESVREWATTEHNQPILIEIAEGILRKNNNSYSDLRFATWMVCESMGL